MSAASPNVHSAAQHQPSMPAVLNREPSQQDLELARHLQSFQSQGVPHQEPPEPRVDQQQDGPDGNSMPYGGEPRRREEHHLQGSSQSQQVPGTPIIQFTPIQQQQHQPSPAPNSIGQMCR